MKIIFDNEEQMNHMTDWYCPGDICLTSEVKYCKDQKISGDVCRECWKKNVEMEIKKGDN